MATAIVSIALREAGVRLLSVALLWLALAAFAVVVADLLRSGARPVGFAAYGLVADTCVLGARLHGGGDGGAADAGAAVLLAVGAVLWVASTVALVRRLPALRVRAARGEWLLAVVAGEGLAILTAVVGVSRAGAVVLWALGATLYFVTGVVLAVRLRRAPLRPGELTPDWWIVMGGLAIVCLASVTVRTDPPGTVEGVVGALAWVLAGVFLLVMAAAEVWQARRVGRVVVHFTPERWTMVFPLGMYSASSQLAGHALALPWMATIGRWWVWVALAAWLSVAAGELHHMFARG
jgi:tellurite resistance protein TehA-like permease